MPITEQDHRFFRFIALLAPPIIVVVVVNSIFTLVSGSSVSADSMGLGTLRLLFVIGLGGMTFETMVKLLSRRSEEKNGVQNNKP